MINETIWYSGLDSYKKHTIIDPEKIDRDYSIELLDKEIPIRQRNIYEIFNDHISCRQTNQVEVLYSGGLDSELVLHVCVINKTPVKAITMRLHIDGVPLNVHDLYYSEKFCREHRIEQRIIDLDVDKFFGNGEHEKYLDRHRINQPHVATHMWLFEQCSGFPILAGEYPWPWTASKIISPIRYEYSQYDRFLSDRGIEGIGSMLDYSLEATLLMIRTHINVMRSNPNFGGAGIKIAKFKAALYKDLGFTNVVPRFRGYGWETVHKADFSKQTYTIELMKKYGLTRPTIKWNNLIANALDTVPGLNSQF